MRLDEITVGRAAQKLIQDTLRQIAREGNAAASEFDNTGKTKIASAGAENLVTVIFLLGDRPRAAGSMRFAGTGKDQDELDFEQKQQRAKDLADTLVTRLGDFIYIEDYSIDESGPAYSPSINLFMVSDGFTGTEL